MTDSSFVLDALGSTSVNNSTIVDTVCQLVYANTTGEVKVVRVEATISGLVSWNTSYPSVARSYYEWSTLSSGAGGREVVPEHADGSVTSVLTTGTHRRRCVGARR